MAYPFNQLPDHVDAGNGKYAKLVQLSGSNVEQTPGQAVPAKAVWIGARDASGNMLGLYGDYVSSDGQGNKNAVWAGAMPFLYNGSNWDRVRNNIESNLLNSLARTTTATSPTQTNFNGRGVILTLDVTANPGGAETLSVNVGAIDAVGKKKYVAAVSIPAATNGTYLIVLYPGINPPALTGVTPISSVIPRRWDVTIAPSGSGSWTYGLTASTIL